MAILKKNFFASLQANMQAGLILKTGAAGIYPAVYPGGNTAGADDLLSLKNRHYKKIDVENIVSKITFSMIFALLMWVSANSFIYLPFTPVPLTMQVFTVLFCAIMLGKYWAVAAQVQYLMLGLFGLPVFAGFKNAAALAGPTGGYIAGFLAGTFACAYIYESLSRSNIQGTCVKTGINNKDLKRFLIKSRLNNSLSIFFAGLCGVAVIYFTGYIHLVSFFYLANYNQADFLMILISAFKLGVAPFIIIDIGKTALVAIIFKTIEKRTGI